MANTGTLPEGAKILPFKGYPAVNPEKRSTGSEPLVDENEVEWAGDISIGSNAQPFLIDFDTGSSDLWVPNTKCSSAPCRSKHKYNPSGSSTSKSQSGVFQIHYGDGSTVSGPIFTDTGK